jgi:hypothetical protein
MKKIFYQLALFSFVAFSLVSRFALAYDCEGILRPDLEEGNAPSPVAIVCVVGRLLNIALLFVGLVFIAVIAFSAWKLSLAFGDPKGFQGARNTWTYAVLGGLIVVGVFAVSLILANFFGIPGIITPQFLVERLETGLIDLMSISGITEGTP